MKCSVCHENDATIHLTEIISNQVIKLHLCEECAKKRGISFTEGFPFPHFSLADLLAGLTDLGIEAEPRVVTTLRCPTCHLTYSDFKESGRLGCSDCYRTFAKQLAPLLKRIHGSPQHIGKKLATTVAIAPEEKVSIQNKREKLEKELKEAIKKEEYERAAEIRDQLKRLGT